MKDFQFSSIVYRNVLPLFAAVSHTVSVRVFVCVCVCACGEYTCTLVSMYPIVRFVSVRLSFQYNQLLLTSYMYERKTYNKHDIMFVLYPYRQLLRQNVCLCMCFCLCVN